MLSSAIFFRYFKNRKCWWKYFTNNYPITSICRIKGVNRGRVAIISTLSRGVSWLFVVCQRCVWERLKTYTSRIQIEVGRKCNCARVSLQCVLLSVSKSAALHDWCWVPTDLSPSAPGARRTLRALHTKLRRAKSIWHVWCAHCAAELEHRLGCNLQI